MLEHSSHERPDRNCVAAKEAISVVMQITTRLVGVTEATWSNRLALLAKHACLAIPCSLLCGHDSQS